MMTYEEQRNALIPQAEIHANNVTNKLDAEDKYSADWTRAFHKEMDRLCRVHIHKKGNGDG